mmetsp:Transcript_177486/g.569223  ORF Transcript_177486/g.569223 Transcript_177486/m.569223 type:complete len:206 (-) Transcript_177486:48-665(-)
MKRRWPSPSAWCTAICGSQAAPSAGSRPCCGPAPGTSCRPSCSTWSAPSSTQAYLGTTCRRNSPCRRAPCMVCTAASGSRCLVRKCVPWRRMAATSCTPCSGVPATRRTPDSWHPGTAPGRTWSFGPTPQFCGCFGGAGPRGSTGGPWAWRWSKRTSVLRTHWATTPAGSTSSPKIGRASWVASTLCAFVGPWCWRPARSDLPHC